MWNSPSGLVILGSYESPIITEKISSDDGSVSVGFDLVTDTYSACVINLGPTMLVTGREIHYETSEVRVVSLTDSIMMP